MKVIVYGSKGWIGGQFIDLLKKQNVLFFEGKSRVDNVEDLELEITEICPTHVVSFIGRTHGQIGDKVYSTIDYLEEDGKLFENVRDNLYSPLILAHVCTKYNIHYTYFGTGCVFKFDEEHPFEKEENGFHEASLPNFYAVENTLEHIPVFVRSGAFIPMANDLFYTTEEYNPNDVSVHFYVDEALTKSTGVWYEDDGITAGSTESGQYQAVTFSFDRKKKYGQIAIESLSPSNKLFIEKSTLVVHVENYGPTKIKLNNKKITYEVAENGTISIPITKEMLKRANIQFYWK